jgi:hypothetical protein
MAYQSGAGIEQQWCNYVKARVSQPFQLVPGNHEAQNGDGLFSQLCRVFAEPPRDQRHL